MKKRKSQGPGISFFAFQDIVTAVVGIFILITLILVLELIQRVEAKASSNSTNVAPVVEAIELLEKEIERIQAEIELRSKYDSANSTTNAFNRAENIEALKQKVAVAGSQLQYLKAQMERIQSEKQRAMSENDRLLSDAADLAGSKTRVQELEAESKEVLDRAKNLEGNRSEIYRDKIEDGRFVVLIKLNASRIEIRDAYAKRVTTFGQSDRVSRLSDWLRAAPLEKQQLLLLVEPGGADDFQAVRSSLDRYGAVYGYSVVGSQHSIQLAFEIEEQR